MDLSRHEQEILLTSLAACTPSGGGSAPWTLARKLMAEWAMEPNTSSVVAYQQRAQRELTSE